MNLPDIQIGDCHEVMKRLIKDGVQYDSIVTEPPCNGEAKNYQESHAFNPDTWMLCLDLLKPGGMMAISCEFLSYHRIAAAIERAGAELYRLLMWPPRMAVTDSEWPQSRTVLFARKPGGKKPYDFSRVEEIFTKEHTLWVVGLCASKIPDTSNVILKRILCRYCTAPRGTVLDIFAWNPTVGISAVMEHYPAVLIARDSQKASEIKDHLFRVNQSILAKVEAKV